MALLDLSSPTCWYRRNLNANCRYTRFFLVICQFPIVPAVSTARTEMRVARMGCNCGGWRRIHRRSQCCERVQRKHTAHARATPSCLRKAYICACLPFGAEYHGIRVHTLEAGRCGLCQLMRDARTQRERLRSCNLGNTLRPSLQQFG